MNEQYKKAFTIIELLVVIAIIAVLASIVLVNVNSFRAKARDVKRMADVKQIQTALELYYIDNGFYSSIGSDNMGYDWSGLSTLLAPYISTIPTDPSGSSWHTFQYVRGPVADNSYGIWIRREQTGYCKSGVNINMGWWGTGVPLCQ